MPRSCVSVGTLQNYDQNNLPGCFNYKADVANFTSHVHQTMLNNTTIIACNNNYNQLCFLKSLLIKRYIPQLNCGIKLQKSLNCFSFKFNLNFSIFVIFYSHYIGIRLVCT